jgi:multidrug efflux pump subunit AcrB
MERIFRYFIKNNRLTFLITLVIILGGYFSYTNMNLDLMPKVDFGQTVITTIYPGASPEDVERQVTNKIEDELKSVSGIKKTISSSIENSSFVQIWIDPNVRDIKQVNEDISAAMDRIVDFPKAMDHRPVVKPLDSSIFPVIEVGISGNMPYKDLWELAYLYEKKLKVISGVSHLESYGYNAKEVQIEVNSKKLDQYQIGLAQIVGAIQNRNQRSSGGALLSYSDEKSVVTRSEFQKPLEVGDVIVKSSFEGFQVRVKDLAIVSEGFERPRVLSRSNGKESINFIIFKTGYADITDTVQKIKEMSDEFKLKNKNIEIVYSNDNAKIVENRFWVLASNGIQGLFLIWIVLSLFLSFDISLWVSLGIPVSMAGVLIVLNIMGFSLDALSLSGMILVLGIMVDDAVIVSENIHRHRSELGKSPLDATIDGLKEVAHPVVATVLVTICAFGPMFFMKGLMGKFIFVIPLVVTVSMAVGVFEALFLMPSHLIHGLQKGVAFESKRMRWYFWLKNKFYKSLLSVLAHRKKVVIGFFTLLGLTLLFAFNFMDFILFPSSTAERVFIHLEVPAGSSLEANRDKTLEVEKIVGHLPKDEVISFVSRIGVHTSENQAPKASNNLTTIEINLLPFGQRKRNASEIIEILKKESNKLSGFESITYEMIEGGPPMGSPISLKIVGVNDEERNLLANEAFNYLKTIPGVKSLSRDDKKGKSELKIQLDYSEVSRLGVDIPSVNNTLRMAYDGLEVTEGRFNGQDIGFRVILEKDARSDEKRIENLKVVNEMGRLIPLGQLAKFETNFDSVGEILHHNGETAITISGDIEKGVTSSLNVTNQVLNKFKNSEKFKDARIIVSGEAEETVESLESLGVTFIIAIFAIYFILVHLFDSFIQPFYVLLAVTFGTIGVTVSFYLHGEPFGFMAILGVVGLSGIVVNDAIVLVDFVNNLRKTKLDKPIEQIVAEGASDRLRQGLVTTVSAMVGVLPMAYGIGGADVFMVPMALAMGYGLLFAVLMNLYILPCVYLTGEELLGKVFKKKKTVQRPYEHQPAQFN